MIIGRIVLKVNLKKKYNNKIAKKYFVFEFAVMMIKRKKIIII